MAFPLRNVQLPAGNVTNDYLVSVIGFGGIDHEIIPVSPHRKYAYSHTEKDTTGENKKEGGLKLINDIHEQSTWI